MPSDVTEATAATLRTVGISAHPANEDRPSTSPGRGRPRASLAGALHLGAGRVAEDDRGDAGETDGHEGEHLAAGP